MTYMTHAAMAENVDLRRRFAAAAATEGVDDAQAWAIRNMLYMIHADAIAAWESALAAAANVDPDAADVVGGMSIGADATVVTDGMILSAVQARVAEQMAAAVAAE